MTHVTFREAPTARVVQLRDCTFKKPTTQIDLEVAYPINLPGEIVFYTSQRRKHNDPYIATRRIIITRSRPTNPLPCQKEPILEDVPEFTYPGMRTRESVTRQIKEYNNGRDFYLIVSEKFVTKPVKGTELKPVNSEEEFPIYYSDDYPDQTIIDGLAYSIPFILTGQYRTPNPVVYSFFPKYIAGQFYEPRLMTKTVDRDGIHMVAWQYPLEPFDKAPLVFKGYGDHFLCATKALIDHIRNFAYAMSYTKSLAPPRSTETNLPQWVPSIGCIQDNNLPIRFDNFVARCSERPATIVDIATMLGLNLESILKELTQPETMPTSTPTTEEFKQSKIKSLIREIIEGSVHWSKYLDILPPYLYMGIDKEVDIKAPKTRNDPVLIISEFERTFGYRSEQLSLYKDTGVVTKDWFGEPTLWEDKTLDWKISLDPSKESDYYDSDLDSDPC